MLSPHLLRGSAVEVDLKSPRTRSFHARGGRSWCCEVRSTNGI